MIYERSLRHTPMNLGIFRALSTSWPGGHRAKVSRLLDAETRTTHGISYFATMLVWLNSLSRRLSYLRT